MHQVKKAIEDWLDSMAVPYRVRRVNEARVVHQEVLDRKDYRLVEGLRMCLNVACFITPHHGLLHTAYHGLPQLPAAPPSPLTSALLLPLPLCSLTAST